MNKKNLYINAPNPKPLITKEMREIASQYCPQDIDWTTGESIFTIVDDDVEKIKSLDPEYVRRVIRAYEPGSTSSRQQRHTKQHTGKTD